MSAHAQDAMIADLWKTVQSLPQYKNKTTLLITADHGRGDSVKKQWRDHGEKIAESSSIWIAVLGPDTKVTGERKGREQNYQRQVAPTIAALLGVDFKPAHPIPPAVITILQHP
jgi:bisphosphoglycerate-independent phosphoglycerate mutase (AlkP superfamily)